MLSALTLSRFDKKVTENLQTLIRFTVVGIKTNHMEIVKSLDMILHTILIIGILINGLLITQFLISAGKKSKKDDPHALGLPQGSVRAVLSISLIVFFVLIALFFYLNTTNPESKSELAESILTILGTLVIAVSSFYFGIKATEQGNKIAQETFKEASQAQKAKEDKNIPPIIIQDAISKNEAQWKEQYKCIDIKLGKKKSGQTEFDLICIAFVVDVKNEQIKANQQIPAVISYTYQRENYNIPTDVVIQDSTQYQSKYNALSEEQQYKLVEAYMEHKLDDFLDAHPSVTGAAAAKMQKANLPIPLITLQLQVEKKSTKISKPIPPFVLYDSYKIPTDVVEAGETEATISLNPVLDGVSRLNDKDFGSLGFPVYYNGELHILSCYHVLFANELNQGVKSINQATSNITVVSPPFTGSSNKIGDVVQGQFSKRLDVAILKPTPALKAKYEQEGFSTEWAYLRRDQEEVSYFKFKGSKSKKIKKPYLMNISTIQPVKFQIGGNKEVVRMKGLIQMERAALEGDSGAAVYDYRDRIVGIIVAKDSKYCYAISAYTIFSKTEYSLKS